MATHRRLPTGALLILLAAWSAAAANAAPLRVLILSGQNNHDWRQTTPALQSIYGQSGRFAAEITENPSSLDAATLAKYDVVVSNWTNYPSNERLWGPRAEQALFDFVRGGKGYVVFHAAAACFMDWPEYLRLIGASWALGTTAHGAIHTFTVKMADQTHPITRGLPDLDIRDELWHRMAVQPTAHVLATAFSSTETGGTGKDEPVAFATEFGKGRCFNLALGHDAAAMETATWRLLMLRGTEWAATSPVTVSLPVDIDIALNGAARYQRTQSRAPLEGVNMLVQRAAADPSLRAQLAAKMVERLRSDATTDAKAFLLQQLSLIGSAPEVPAVAALVADRDLGFYALAALQRIPGEEASAALRAAMTTAQGPTLAGIINALGERRDAKAVASIARHLAGDDPVAGCAISALGRIGGAPAIAALERFSDQAAPALAAQAADALLQCADRLLAARDVAQARPIYQSLASPRYPEQVRLAAFVGSVTCAKDERVPLVLGALAGDDRGLQAAAAHCLSSLRDGELAKAVAARLSTFRPPVQAEVLDALGEMGAADLAPTVAKVVSSADPSVRLAAVRALGRLGGAAAYPALMQALRASPSDSERAEIERALVAACRRTEKTTGVLPFTLADLSRESSATRSSLFHVLGLLGDAKSLDLLRAALKDPSAETRLAALGALAEWPDGTPMADLLAVVRSAGAAEKAAAFRGLAALAPRSRGAPEATVQLLADAMALAQAVEDKRVLLDALAQIRSPAALKLAVAGLGDPSVVNEACTAAIRIAAGLPPSDKDAVQAALTRVLAASKVDAIRTSAKQTLMALGIPVEVTRSATLTNTGPNLALGATATSPDNLDSDGAASGDQAAIDGDPSTYWDEVDNQPLYVLRVTFKAPTLVSALRITGYQQHAYAPKDFGILCDDKVVKTVKDAWYESNQFAVTFPPTRCTSLELRITGYWGLSPAIRELEIFNPATPGQ